MWVSKGDAKNTEVTGQFVVFPKAGRWARSHPVLCFLVK